MAARAVALTALAALSLAAPGCGGDDSEPQRDPFEAISGDPPPQRHGAAPRWEHLSTLSGAGPRTQSVSIDRRAIQWRARWRCDEGQFRIELDPPPPGGKPLTERKCPARGADESIQTGSVKVRVTASAGWKLKVEQQVDTPLREPPLAGMSRRRLIASGDFYMVDKPGKGTANVYRLPGGRLALRLDGFQTSPNVDLFVWLSESPGPRTTKAAFGPRHVVASELKSTIGDQNYLLPRDVEPRQIRSIVIWCEPVRNVYTAAALRPHE